jgi:hypothetical protein
LNFGIRLAGAVPQVIIFHCLFLLHAAAFCPFAFSP